MTNKIVPMKEYPDRDEKFFSEVLNSPEQQRRRYQKMLELTEQREAKRREEIDREAKRYARNWCIQALTIIGMGVCIVLLMHWGV
jgi:hypothetical protein